MNAIRPLSRYAYKNFRRNQNELSEMWSPKRNGDGCKRRQIERQTPWISVVAVCRLVLGALQMDILNAARFDL